MSIETILVVYLALGLLAGFVFYCAIVLAGRATRDSDQADAPSDTPRAGQTSKLPNATLPNEKLSDETPASTDEAAMDESTRRPLL